jgi:hypothetical protein
VWGSECIFVRDKALGGIIMPVNRRVAINIVYKLNLMLGGGQDEMNSQFPTTPPHVPM